jgi:hypothetical protein
MINSGGIQKGKKKNCSKERRSREREREKIK